MMFDVSVFFSDQQLLRIPMSSLHILHLNWSTMPAELKPWGRLWGCAIESHMQRVGRWITPPNWSWKQWVEQLNEFCVIRWTWVGQTEKTTKPVDWQHATTSTRLLHLHLLCHLFFNSGGSKNIFLSRPINVTGTWKCCFVELLILTQTWLENHSGKTAWFLARPITQCHESGRIALEFPSTYESSNLFTQHAACAVWFPCKQCRQVLPQRAADRCYAATRSAVDVLPNLQQVFQAFHTENDCELPSS